MALPFLSRSQCFHGPSHVAICRSRKPHPCGPDRTPCRTPLDVRAIREAIWGGFDWSCVLLAFRSRRELHGETMCSVLELDEASLDFGYDLKDARFVAHLHAAHPATKKGDKLSRRALRKRRTVSVSHHGCSRSEAPFASTHSSNSFNSSPSSRFMPKAPCLRSSNAKRAAKERSCAR